MNVFLLLQGKEEWNYKANATISLDKTRFTFPRRTYNMFKPVNVVYYQANKRNMPYLKLN